MYDRWYMIYYWYLIYDIWYSIFDIYFFSHILGGSFFLSPKLGGRWTDFCIPGRAGRLWWWGGWRGSASGEDTWAAPFRVTWMWYPGIVRSMNHGIFQVHVELIYIYILFFWAILQKKTWWISTKKRWILPLFSTNFPSFPMAVFVVATFVFFFTFAVWWRRSDLDLPRSEDPEFSRFLQTHVVAYPKIGRFNRGFSVDFGGASHRIIFKQPPFTRRVWDFAHISLEGQQTLLWIPFLFFGIIDLVHKSRVSIFFFW